MRSSTPWALTWYMIHINLNIFYTHVEHNQNNLHKVLYNLKKKKNLHYTHYTHTHNDCSRNWVLILVKMEILWEEEGFQFGLKRWQGWAVSKVLWEWIPKVGSKAREGAKAMSLAFVLLDLRINYNSALVHFCLPQVTFLDCEINDIKLTEPEVKEIINNLNTKISIGPDLIHNINSCKWRYFCPPNTFLQPLFK